LFFLNKAYQKNNYFGLYIFTIINFFSYFFYSLIVILCNGLLSIVKLKKKNFHNKLIFFLNFLSIVYLYFCYLIYFQLQSNLNNQGFNLDLQNINLYNFLNLRDFHVSIFLLFLLFFLNYKKLLIKNSSIDSKKIILIYLVTSVLYIVDFFVNIQISDHISRYFVRIFNWFVVLFIFFKLSFFSKLKIKATQTWGILFKDIVFVFIIFYLFASYLANTYLFYKRNNEIYAQDYQNQTNIINDLKEINIFIKNNSLKKNVFIDDAYTNVIASSILQSLNGEDYSLYNPSIFRTYSLNLHDSLILFTDQCFFFNLTKFECYEDFVNYSNNQYLNNSFLFYANRNLNFKDFENIYYLNIDRINKLDEDRKSTRRTPVTWC
jgi:hypothetical protein